MSNVLLLAVALVYAYVSWDYYRQGSLGMAVAFAAYAVSNLGFILHNKTI